MVGAKGGEPTRRRALWKVALTIAVIGSGLLVGSLPQRASATLTGSSFNGTDASPTSDVAAGAVEKTDPIKSADTSNYTGSSEHEQCPSISVGTAAENDDLDKWWVGSEANANGVFLYVAWHRYSLTGTTTVDFELNHNSTPKANCNGVNPDRVDGDILITYDFQGTGPFTADIHLWEWDDTAGKWDNEQTPPASAYEASISGSGDFGELVVNLTLANLLSNSRCESFASVMPKARASKPLTSTVKEFGNPVKAAVSNCGSIKIHKEDDAGADLADVVFDLYTDDGGKVGDLVTPAQNCTTDADGDCTILDVVPGTYWVVERAAPQGYTGADPIKVVVALAGNDPAGTLTFVNTRKPGKINIQKNDDTGAPLAGATFALYTNDNGAVGTAVSGKTCTTGADGKCSITNILPIGKYWLVETVVPANHTGVDPQLVEFKTLDQTFNLTIVNVRKPANVNIVKEDDAGDPLAGAVFGLYTNNNGVVGTAVSGKTCTTGADGKCSITNILPPGTYWVVETTTPDGHETADPQSVTLGLNQTVTLTFTNDRIPGRIDITKKDDTGANLAGATFALYTDVNGVKGSAVSGKTCTTGADGKCSITNILPAGFYWVVETVVPFGHTGDEDARVEVKLNTAIGVSFVNERQPAQVDIVKTTDAGAALAGAVFTLYTDVDDAVGSAVSGKSCTTGSNGKCSITNILPPGTYWVVETTTPPGYYTAAPQQVALGLNQTATLNFENVRKPIAISMTKTANGKAHPESDPLYTESGDLVTYVLTVKNEGELALTITALSDSLKAAVASTCEQGIGSTLGVGEDFTCTYTANPTDDAKNVASVTGTDVLGRTTSDSDEAVVIPLHPAIDVEKSGPSGAHVGDVVEYTFVVKNAGDTPLADVELDDSKCSSAPELQSKAGGDDDASLEDGETWTFTCTYTVAAGDGNSVVNEVTVSGTDMLETTVTDTDAHTFPVLHPALTIDKSASPTTVTGTGTVTYSYLVTNTGDTTLFEVAVTDDILGAIGTIGELAAGASQTLTKTVTVGPGSAPTNVGTVTGVDVLGKKVSATDTQTITVVLGEVIERTLPRTGASVDRQLRWAMALLGFGFALVVVARRRKAVGDRG